MVSVGRKGGDRLSELPGYVKIYSTQPDEEDLNR